MSPDSLWYPDCENTHHIPSIPHCILGAYQMVVDADYSRQIMQEVYLSAVARVSVVHHCCQIRCYSANHPIFIQNNRDEISYSLSELETREYTNRDCDNSNSAERQAGKVRFLERLALENDTFEAWHVALRSVRPAGKALISVKEGL